MLMVAADERQGNGGGGLEEMNGRCDPNMSDLEGHDPRAGESLVDGEVHGKKRAKRMCSLIPGRLLAGTNLRRLVVVVVVVVTGAASSPITFHFSLFPFPCGPGALTRAHLFVPSILRRPDADAPYAHPHAHT